ncbi:MULTISPECIES: helix-turn-helix domain-containing protein [unclassified Pseudonocardia]|uniref:helix-turn-helix domain-containing protein n=1 Tax=unclassified Pseudonocardia TaxID=2619320 RepID=UPI0001FFDF80|nr:helix-turn-helix domain-containing protein [Pseudonocardia sp. Ae707_Ps1]
MLTIEQAEDYTGYPRSVLHLAVGRGALSAEKPGGSLRARLYFDTEELDRWIESAQEQA